jgi:Xaa-Pro aminopeptidase
VLESGMVFSVEPCVHLPGEGGFRPEDDVLVSEGTGESLTASNRELRAIAV